jgi:hypothetical protein
MDLNVDNYNLKQLLELFDINGELTHEKIKICRKKVLALHPDKTLNPLSNPYYEFFTNAYNKLVDVYSYTKSTTNEKNQHQENIEINNTFSNYVQKKNIKDKLFTEEFNKMFENVHIRENDGYEEWLKSDNGIYGTENIKKARETAITLHKKNTIESYNETDKYSDLKDTYMNTVISIDEENEFNNKKKYSSVNEFMIDRDNSINNQNKYTEEEQMEILRENELREQNKALQMAFEMKNKEKQITNRLNTYYTKYLTINK